MRWLVLGLLLFAFPAAADMYQDASNAKLPWHLTTPNDPAMKGGIHITQGYNGVIDNSVQGRWWGIELQQGPKSCEDQYFDIFRRVRGVEYAMGICISGAAPGSTVSNHWGLLIQQIADGDQSGGLAVQGINVGDNKFNSLIGSVGVDTPKTAFFVGKITGTSLVVTEMREGTIGIGNILPATGVPNNTYVLSQSSGTPGGIGTYQISATGNTINNAQMTTYAFQKGGLANNEWDMFCMLGDTACHQHHMVGYFPNGPATRVMGTTIGGTLATGNVLTLTVTDSVITASPRVSTYTVLAGDTLATAAAGLAAAVNGDVNLLAGGYSARPDGNVVRVSFPLTNGPLPRVTFPVSSSATGAATATTALIAAGIEARYSIAVSTGFGGIGKWQEAYIAANGCCDFAFSVGALEGPDGVIGNRSQAIKFHYNDNNVPTQKIATLFVDPALAGTTGTDMVISNNSTQDTNLRLTQGGIVVNTPNRVALNSGINIVSGYTGTLPNASPSRWWGMQVQYGADDCAAHMGKFFRPIRWFEYGIGSCATIPAGSAGSYLASGLYSTQSYSASAALIAQGVAQADGVEVWGFNTLKVDAPIVGDSTAASIAGTTLTVGGTVTGSFSVGDNVNIIGATSVGLTPGSYIMEQLSGTTGGAGTYRLNKPSTLATQALSAYPYRSGVLVQDEYDHFCMHNDTRCRNIIVGHFPNGEQANVHGATVGGTIAAGNQLNLTVTDGLVTGSPRAISYTMIGGDTATTAAAGLAQKINDDANLVAAGYTARGVGALVRIYYPTNNGISAKPTVSFAQSTTGGATLTLALLVNSDNQRFALGTSTFDGKWQNAFQSASGTADFALSVGIATRNNPIGITQRSQGIKFYYTDNTSPNAARVMTMYADPTNAGATGVDLIFNNNSVQATNISLPVGTVKLGGIGTSGVAAGSLCIDAAGVVYKKTTAGACL